VPKAGDTLLLLCTKLCRVIAVVVLYGRESNTRLPVQIRLTGKTTDEISEGERETNRLSGFF